MSTSAKQIKTNLPKQMPSTHALVIAAYESAIAKLAPLWDVHNYVAVNPFLGYVEQDYFSAMQHKQALLGTALLPSMHYFKERYQQAKITRADLNFALAQLKFRKRKSCFVHITVDTLVSTLQQKDVAAERKIKSLSELSDECHQQNISEQINNHLANWLAAYYDEGIASWSMPHKKQGFYHAWKKLITYDKSKLNKRLKLDQQLAHYSNNAHNALLQLGEQLINTYQLNQQQLSNYFHRLFCTLPGWAGYCKRIAFEKQRAGRQEINNDLINLLVVRVLYDVYAPQSSLTPTLVQHNLVLPEVNFSQDDIKYAWQLANEHSMRRELKQQIDIAALSNPGRPDVQMVFCIDVRSEIIRRHLEQNIAGLATLGFAGFFALPIAYKPLAHQHSHQQCPVLLEPKLTVEQKGAHHCNKHQRVLQRISIIKKLKNSTMACFALVESLGLSYLFKGFASHFAWSIPGAKLAKLSAKQQAKQPLEFDLDKIDVATQTEQAYGALQGMGLVKQFAKMVFIVGHHAESANNPYASSLDCGACAGHSGEVNAVLLATILNNPAVRQRLREEKGINIPSDTVFCHATHNTTTDELKLSAATDMPTWHAQKLERLHDALPQVTQQCQQERALTLFDEPQMSSTKKLGRLFQHKARSWAEIRPEWGLARNFAFVIGKREITRGKNLHGRVFLHEYDAKKDQDLQVLTSILTAPVVVAQWINMQYNASTLATQCLGSGDKQLHNVVGSIGCRAGGMGDLLTGLSRQALFNKNKMYHDPVRLQVFVQAQPAALQQIINANEMLKALVENEWLNIIAVNDVEQQFSLFDGSTWINF